MVLVFILCFMIMMIALVICMTILSTLQIELQHFEMSNMWSSHENVAKKYQLKISLKLFGKVKWIGFCLNHRKMKKIENKIKWKKIDLKKMEQDFNLEDLRQIKRLKPRLSYLHTEIKIGVEDAIMTSFIVGIVSSMIGIIFPHVITKYRKNKYYYKIVPLYWNRNVYEFKFDGIIEIKMVHIINILYYFLKKRRGENYEQRTSDRGSYGYSYE